MLGDLHALLALLAASLALIAAAILAFAPRFAQHATAAAAMAHGPGRRQERRRAFRRSSPLAALRRKEWQLLGRDPWLVSQTLMQLLYLVPPAVLLWRSFGEASDAPKLLVPVLVMAAGQLAGGLAWLAISGEDAPDLVATAPIAARRVLRAKIEAVMGVIALVFAPLLAALALAAPGAALAAAPTIALAAASATAIQLAFRTQAQRSHFRRRQTSSRVATFAEAFSSIGWAATGALAAIGSTLALFSALLALGTVMGARKIAPAAS